MPDGFDNRTLCVRGIRPEISCAAGKIICVSPVHKVIPLAGHVNYAASKGAVMMMKSIAQETTLAFRSFLIMLGGSRSAKMAVTQ